MTIGKKITLGFALQIALALALGTIAIGTMRSSTRIAKTLSTEYVPETKIVDELGDAMNGMQLAMRSYGFTADATHLAEAKKCLAEVKTHVVQARELSQNLTDVVGLKQELQNLETSLARYEQMIQQTETKNGEIVSNRERLDTAAQTFLKNLDAFIDFQEQSLQQEIKDGAKADALTSRTKKVTLSNNIRGYGNAARITVFKAQALRDPKWIDEGLKQFDNIQTDMTALTPLVTQAVNIAQLKDVQKSAADYSTAMKDLREDLQSLSEIARRRAEAGSEVQKLVDEIVTAGLQRTTQAAEQSTSGLSLASKLVGTGLGIVVVVALVVAFGITRSITNTLTHIAGTLSEGAEQTAAAAGQVAAASQSLAEGASEQAASLEETSASLEEMSSTTARNAESATTVKEVAQQARQSADSGVTDMNAMSTAMKEIKSSSDEISKIIRTIDEIAFQTNILALNAAVEAARAGEAGMGFAVVADEVRSLAQRAAQAAKETAGKIEAAVTKADQGVKISFGVANRLQEIVDRIRQVDELAVQVATASKEQSQGIQQVNIAVTQMDKVTQSNAANAEESASASEELSGQARALKESVIVLQQLVGGQHSIQVTTPHAVTHRSNAHATSKLAPAKSATKSPASSPAGSEHRNGSTPKGTITARSHRSDELPMPEPHHFTHF